jgi:RNA polymerase sigma factor
MFLRRFFQKSTTPGNQHNDLEQSVALVQQGNSELRNSLLLGYTPFISRVTSKVCKRFIDPSHDEEFSIALEAFDEAMLQYSTLKGSSFLSFADLVIRRRVIDYIRKEARHRGQISLDGRQQVEEEEDAEAIERKVSLQQYRTQYESSLRREEIEHYKEKLKQYDISLADLPDLAPKHYDARLNAISIAKTIVDQEGLRTEFLLKKKLPMKALMNEVEVSRKTVERNRTYIIAIILLLLEDYQYLHQYLQFEQKGGSH